MSGCRRCGADSEFEVCDGCSMAESTQKCVDAVWLIVDHRHCPNRLVDQCAWFDREQAEKHAYNLRTHAGCSLDEIEVVRVRMLDDFAVVRV